MHYGSKAELFVATVEAHTDKELDRILGGAKKDDAPSVLAALGSALSRRHNDQGSLLVEAIIASRHDPTVKSLVATAFRSRRQRIMRLVEQGRANGDIDKDVSAKAVARFAMVIGLGSLLIGSVDHGRVDAQEWTRLIDGVVDGLRPR